MKLGQQVNREDIIKRFKSDVALLLREFLDSGSYATEVVDIKDAQKTYCRIKNNIKGRGDEEFRVKISVIMRNARLFLVRKDTFASKEQPND